MNLISEITLNLVRALEHSKLAVVSQAVVDVGGPVLTADNLGEACRNSGELQVYQNGVEVFLWDGRPLVEFQPVELRQENGQLTASQPYRLLQHVGPLTRQ